MSSVFDLDEPVEDAPLAAAPVMGAAARGAIALAALAIVATTTWLAMRAPQAPEAAPPTALGEAQAVAIAEIVETAPPGAGPQASDEPEPGTVEMCGIGRVRLPELDDQGIPADPLAERTDEALARSLARLGEQPDERGRAAALFVQAASARIKHFGEVVAQRQRDGVDCTKQSCVDGDEPVDVTRALDALVRVAVGTRDPWVYALAYHGCSKQPSLPRSAAACQLISVERWTQLDSNNAMPWLYAAGEAQQRRDSAAVAEAFYRASQAKTSDARFGRLAVELRKQEPSGLMPVVGLSVDARAIAIEAAVSLPGYQQVSQHCGDEALRDPNRRGVCEGLADVLSERSTSLIDVAISLSIGKRLGWSSARIEAMEQRRDALQAVAGSDTWDAKNGTLKLDCETVARQREWVLQMAELGEVGALRLRIERSGRSQGELAASHRRSVEPSKKVAAADGAASGATEASALADGMLRTASATP